MSLQIQLPIEQPDDVSTLIFNNTYNFTNDNTNNNTNYSRLIYLKFLILSETNISELCLMYFKIGFKVMLMLIMKMMISK